MSKGSKEALTVLIVTHVAHVERVKRSLNSFNCYSCYSCQKGRKYCLWLLHKSVLCIKWPLAPPKYAVRAHNFFTHNFLNIQQIFNPQKVLKSWDLDLSTHTIQCYVYQSMLKGSKVKITFDFFNINSEKNPGVLLILVTCRVSTLCQSGFSAKTFGI